MNTVWYCKNCEKQIDRTDVEDHETQGHTVRGTMRPDRLIGNDPWNIELTDEEVTD